MEIIKISTVGIITAFCVIVLKDSKSELSVLLIVLGSIFIIFILLNYISNIILIIKNLCLKVGISSEILKTIFKVIGIGFITEFSADIIEESGSKSLASKVITAGKIIIFYISLPIIISLFDIISELIQ